MNTLNIQIDNGTPTTASYTAGVVDSTYPLSIGGHVNSTYIFNGRIDEVTLYKRVLSASERSWMYNSGTGRAYSEVNPTSTHTYGNASHKHAVTALVNGNTYTYDNNGNMISRHVLEGTSFQDYALGYDAENRLVKVCEDVNNPAVCDAGETVVAQFTYDADGKRVKSVMGADTILFVGAHYEVKNGSEITKYYMAGSTRIAMRKYTIPQNMTVEYLLSDHLGSTSLTTDANGAKVLELRYKAWGEVRASWTASPTTTPAYKSPAYTYTGQYSYMDDPTTSSTTEGFGLMFYNARWYDPALGRSAQADTMIPQEQGTQAWDRYAYTNNNPVRYNDPTGHMVDEGDTRDDGGDYTSQDQFHDAVLQEQNEYIICESGNESYCSSGDYVKMVATGDRKIGWDASLVPWDDVAIDLLGIIGDAIPIAQLPATYAEGAKLFNWSISGVEAYDNGWDIAQGDRDYTAVALDTISLVPEFGAVGSVLGLVHNVLKGFYLY